MISDALERCTRALKAAGRRPWVIGYSGGKDSTATLKMFLHSARQADLYDAHIVVIYCDTGVENPELDLFAKHTLARMAIELPKVFPNSKVEILKAPVNERFFVRVIGRGYAPPSNRFRWCTKGLRILPVQRYLKATAIDAAVVLGLRYGESAQRDRSLHSAGAEGVWQRQREGSQRDLFLPIFDLGLEEVWSVAQGLPFPYAINALALEELYRGASDECPMVKSPLAPPCASGRFGCWTCTVVRRDRSTENLVRQGMTWLEPYLEFRNWLQEIRADAKIRWPVRRNGAAGPGPFTLKGRRLLLRKLELLETEVDRELVSDAELLRIQELWEMDTGIEKALGIR